jgi:hypothetical protein
MTIDVIRSADIRDHFMFGLAICTESVCWVIRLREIHYSDALMRCMNEFLFSRPQPFDIYELALFRLVVHNGSFTKAAAAAGLTQSAITRQVQGIEESHGLQLLERTTRSVRANGRRANSCSGNQAGCSADVEQTLRRLREDFGGARKEVHVGVSRNGQPAHLPGFFHANVRKLPDVMWPPCPVFAARRC